MVDLWSPTDEVVVTNTVDIPVPNPGLMKTHWAWLIASSLRKHFVIRILTHYISQTDQPISNFRLKTVELIILTYMIYKHFH